MEQFTVLFMCQEELPTPTHHTVVCVRMYSFNVLKHLSPAKRGVIQPPPERCLILFHVGIPQVADSPEVIHLCVSPAGCSSIYTYFLFLQDRNIQRNSCQR